MKKNKAPIPFVGAGNDSGNTENPLDSFHKRLDEWIGCYCNGDISEFAEATNLSVSSLRGYLRRGNLPNLPGFLAICATGADPTYLLFGVRQQEPHDRTTKYVFTPEEAAALLERGNTLQTERAETGVGDAEPSISKLSYSRQWAATHGFDDHDPVFVSAKSGSMEPTITRDSIVVLDPDDRTPDDRVYLIHYKGETGFRRFIPAGAGAVTLAADNPQYPGIEVSKDNRSKVRVYGRVRYVWNGVSFA